MAIVYRMKKWRSCLLMNCATRILDSTVRGSSNLVGLDMLKITLSELLALKPCNPESRKALFGRRKTMGVATALKRGATIHDILWAAAKVGRRDLCIKFALTCAVRAEKFDKTGTSKSCNDATAAYVADPSPANLETLRGKRQAANAAAKITL